MNDLDSLFRRRIGFPQNEEITFENLGRVLEKTATTLPFENLRIIANTAKEITRDHLIDKVLINREGGLCYELNPLLYYFLLENGFDVVLTRGVVYQHEQQTFMDIGRTHVTVLLTHDGKKYVVDTGFGGNLPLKPVPLTGECTSSGNGEFRIAKMDSGYGDHVLEMKLKHKDTDWKTGYAFYADRPITGISECEDVRTIIAGHPDSPFNKTPLITRLTGKGNVTLTHSSFTRWENGTVTKEDTDAARFEELLERHFKAAD